MCDVCEVGETGDRGFLVLVTEQKTVRVGKKERDREWGGESEGGREGERG